MSINNVTVVVPVYSDWESLEQCISSLLEHVRSPHKVLFVNDCGPEADFLEREITERIKGNQNFRYERNDKNLGFVGTCNRAALELDTSDNDILLLNSDTIVTEGFLDEMVAVLGMNDKHGAVCPRSSNATIASVPFRFQSPLDERGTEYAWDVYTRIRDDLPRISVAPVAVGFCILVRRSLIRNFGLFDSLYGLGYSEENDFCFRINTYGYSSVIANHAFVYHLESRSFSSEKRSQLVERNEVLMRARYPFFQSVVDRYIDHYIDPVDWFGDVLARRAPRRKILLDLYHLPLSFNGTSRNALSLLAYLAKHAAASDNEYVILAQKDASIHYDLPGFGFRIVFPGAINETFDVGYVPSQVFHLPNLFILNRYCLKIVVSDLDIIGIRTNKLLSKHFDQRAIFLDSFRFSDRIISISRATRDDTLAYYGSHLIDEGKFTVIPQGFPGDTFTRYESNLDLQKETSYVPESVLKSGFILIMGNDYAHKAVRQALEALKDSKHAVVVFGMSPHDAHDHVYAIESGGVSDAYLTKLMRASRVIVFPSLYEGFGLPIAEAAYHSKPIVLAETDVAHEVASLYSNDDATRYFTVFDEIGSLAEELWDKKPDRKKADSRTDFRMLDDYNHDVIAELTRVAGRAKDVAELRERWIYFTQLEEYRSAGGGSVTNLRVRLATGASRRFPTAYRHARSFYRRYMKR